MNEEHQKALEIINNINKVLENKSSAHLQERKLNVLQAAALCSLIMIVVCTIGWLCYKFC